jgi:hypothetical protein
LASRLNSPCVVARELCCDHALRLEAERATEAERSLNVLHRESDHVDARVHWLAPFFDGDDVVEASVGQMCCAD